MLEVGCRGAHRAEHRRAEGAARGRHSEQERHTRSDFEAPRGDVLVRNPVAGQVEKRPERERANARPGESAAGGAACDVQGDDQAPGLPACPQSWGGTPWMIT